MKTQFSRRAKFLSPSAGLAVGVLVLLIFIGVILRVFFPGALSFVSAPFWHAGNFAVSTLPNFESADTLRTERDQLLVEARTLRTENEILKARLTDAGIGGATPYEEGIFAGVLARPPLSPYDTLILGAGTDKGVRVGALVLAEGAPIGLVEEAGSTHSRVLLFSATGKANEGWVGEERLPLTITGEGAGAFSAEIPRELPVSVGDMLYLPGPGALPIGTVREIENHPSSPSAKLRIAPLVNPFALTGVRIVSAP